MAKILATCSRLTVAAAIVSLGLPARAEVLVEGLEEPLLGNVLAFLSLDELECDLEAADVRREFAAAEPEIAEALSAYGYYEPAIEPSLEFTDGCWNARFAINAGRQTTIRTFDFAVTTDEADPVFERIRQAPGLAAGEGLDHGRYEALKRRLLDAARDRGYPEAEFESNRIDIWPAEAAADISLRFDTGPRYRIGEIRLEQDALAAGFVSSFVTIEENAPFDNRDLAATYVSLTDSGYFESIDVRPLAADAASRTIPVRISLVASPRLRINYGIGFSTDTGPRFRIGREIRRFNDRGHQMTVQSQLSPVVSEVTANYRLPYGDPRFEWASFDGGLKREETETATSRSLELGARRVLERARGWSRTQFVDLLVEDFDIADQIGRSRLLMPGISWTRLQADDTLRPARGSKLELELRGAGDAIGSDTTFVQTIFDYKVVRSFGEASRVLLRATVGATAEDRFEDLPPSVRFFAGGDNSIRGYAFDSLGPVDATGKVIGGNQLAIGSLEYEYRIRPRWSVATFVDSGNAFTSSDLDAKTSVGIGTRWISPLGPIRFDIGVPLNDAAHGPRIHISLGPDL